MSRLPKVDRARRNALKAGSLVLGSLLVAVTPFKQASALGDFPPRNPPPGPDPFLANPPPAESLSWRWRQLLCAGHPNPDAQGLSPDRNLGSGRRGRGAFWGLRADQGNGQSHLEQRVGQMGRQQSNLPVLIRRGALGENLPAADLCLTALHAVYVDGFLMNVGDLVNGTSITFEAAGGQDTLDFFNIELDRHDILDVQGASCESLYRAGTERCAPLLALRRWPQQASIAHAQRGITRGRSAAAN